MGSPPLCISCVSRPGVSDVVCLPSQGMISLVLQCVDRLHVYSSAAHFAEVAGREAGESWKSILNSLYELLGKEDAWGFKAAAVSIEKEHRALTVLLVLASCEPLTGKKRDREQVCRVISHRPPSLDIISLIPPLPVSVPSCLLYSVLHLFGGKLMCS